MTHGTTTEHELSHPALADYSLRERQAILVHKYFLGIERNCDPGMERAVADWEQRYAQGWRRERHLADCREQMEQIEAYRRELGGRGGCDISWEEAAHDWIGHHAERWRATNGF